MTWFPRWQKNITDSESDPPEPVDLTKLPKRPRRANRSNVPTVDLEANECRWPMNDGPNWLHCGAKKAGSGPYCAGHEKIAYNPGAKRYPLKP